MSFGPPGAFSPGASANSPWHWRIAGVASAGCVLALAWFRIAIELGFAPAGSLQVRGVPVEYPFLAWFVALWAISRTRGSTGRVPGNAIRVQFWLSVLGMAGSIWLWQQLLRAGLVLSAAWVYWLAAGCVAAVFSSAATHPGFGKYDSRLNWSDLPRLAAKPTTCAAVATIVGLFTVAPRSAQIPSGGAAFERWYLRQTRQELPASWQTGPVTLIEFIDYQCPACKAADNGYRAVIQGAEARHAEVFRFLRLDFPLERECNDGINAAAREGPHTAACEAAAAVRLARAASPEVERQVIDWLWTNQRQLSPQMLFDGLQARCARSTRVCCRASGATQRTPDDSE